LQDVRSAAATGDVVAYLPSNLTARPILGHAVESTDFAILAMTGMEGYFSSESYSKSFAVPGLRGRDAQDVLAQAQSLYAQRRDDVESYVRGETNNAGRARLAHDRVRWIIVWGDAAHSSSSSAIPWRKTRTVLVYRLPQ
jgi:hypothetical protein